MRERLSMGQRVAQIRQLRGISRDVLADRVGHSVEWLKSIELGRRQLDRWSTIAALADALEIEVTILLGLPRGEEGTPEQQRAHLGIPRVRRAVLRGELPQHTGGVPVSLDDLRARGDQTRRLRRHALYGDLAGELPQLLDDARNTALQAEGSERERAFGILAQVRHDAAWLTKRLGYTDLASLAAGQAVRAAHAAGDPLLVTAMLWTQAEVYMSAGAVDEAHEITGANLDALDGLMGDADTEVLSLWGTMHLVEAIIQAHWKRGQDAADHLREAAVAADRVGDGRNDYLTEFGRPNHAVLSVEVSLELGGGPDVLDRCAGVDLASLPKDRRARYGIDRAMAYSRAGDDAAAMTELLKADKIACEYVRNHPITHELAQTASTRAKVATESICAAVRRFGL